MVTDSGEEFAVDADDRLRAALPGPPRPRQERLETSMDSSLSPREIQARIRAGETLEAVADVAGMPLERVERFAAPVLAEREHLALMAMSSSVRRRGETSGHRTLRATVSERLLKRGVDADRIAWDAHRVDDGRWAVTADYQLAEEAQHATFLFDPRGRFSVAADDPARWLISEDAPAGGGRRRPTAEQASEEPTVDLSDELALVRAVQEAPAPSPEQESNGSTDETTTVATERIQARSEVTVLRTLHSVPPLDSAPSPGEVGSEHREGVEVEARQTVDDKPDDRPDEPEDAQNEAPAARPAAAPDPGPDEQDGAEQDGDQQDGDQQDGDDLGEAAPSELDALYSMLGSDGYSEDSPRVYAGLSDASAVPETANGGWEPAIVINYPVEPSLQDEAELPPGEHPDRASVPLDDKASVELIARVEGDPDRPSGTDEPAPPYARTNEADRAEEAEEFQLEAEPPPVRKPVKRKRASVPSWDEIMFGGPKAPG